MARVVETMEMREYRGDWDWVEDEDEEDGIGTTG